MFWKHGHTDQAVQKVTVEGKLIEHTAVVGPHLGALLRSCLTGPNTRAAGGRLYDVLWAKAVQSGHEGKTFALNVQARALENGGTSLWARAWMV